jgi:hypothetical protein
VASNRYADLGPAAVSAANGDAASLVNRTAPSSTWAENRRQISVSDTHVKAAALNTTVSRQPARTRVRHAQQLRGMEHAAGDGTDLAHRAAQVGEQHAKTNRTGHAHRPVVALADAKHRDVVAAHNTAHFAGSSRVRA